MLFPIERLLEGRDPPLTVHKDTSIREALGLMVEYDYSQLPVVDPDGLLLGLISQETVTHRYFHLQGGVPLLDLKVDHCLTSAVTLTPDRDLLEALDRLKDVYAIVVTMHRRPVGILTNYDTTHFFRDLTEDLILVEDIEVTLRNYIETAFPSEGDLEAALAATFAKGRPPAGDQTKQFDTLNFREHILLITAPENWPRFEKALAPMELFVQLMEQVRHLRNQLAHFRGRPDPVQHDALLHARSWLESRPSIGSPEKTDSLRVRVEHSMQTAMPAISKYGLLSAWLDARRKQGDTRLTLGFGDIEAVIQDYLPEAAHDHRSWWANDTSSHVQSQAWLAAGWQVEDVNLQAEEVEFRQTNRALMQMFFADILRSLKEARPGVTRAERTQAQNWWSMSAGRSGFSVGWVFDGQGRFRVELYIDTGDRDRNKAAFDALYSDRTVLGGEIGETLVWEKLDPKRASRVFASRSVLITDSPETLAQARNWAVTTTLKFLDSFQNRITSL